MSLVSGVALAGKFTDGHELKIQAAGAKDQSLTLEEAYTWGKPQELDTFAKRYPALTSLTVRRDISISCDLKKLCEELQKIPTLRELSLRFFADSLDQVEPFSQLTQLTSLDLWPAGGAPVN